VRFVILGAGAVGGTIGGLLNKSGHDVVLLARGEHAAVMRRDGLRLATPQRVVVARAPVVERPDELDLRDDDVLVLTAKSQQTTQILDALPRRDLPVVCAQNGVANERMALRRVPRVYGMVVMLPAVFLEPGRVDAQGTPYSGLLDVGRYPTGSDETAAEVAAALTRSGFVSAAVPDIMRWKHAKLLRNLGNALEALSGHGLDEDGKAIIRDLQHEARAEAERCYAAAGVAWASDEEWHERRQLQVQWAPVEGRGRGGGSTWQSFARGRADVEVDHLNGEIVLLGRLHGVPTPVNAMLQEQTWAAIRAGSPPGSIRPQQLVAALPR
jgi:2-dehydropantoate 2-reductase